MPNSVTTLRPNATVLNSGTLVGGATCHAILSDNSDASYITGIDTARVAFGTFAFPALSQIRHVIPIVRVWDNGVGFGQYFGLMNDDGSGGSWTWQVSPSGGPGNMAGATEFLNGSGGAWTQADIDRLAMNHYAVYSDMRYYEAYLDVYYNQAPVVSALTPTGSITITNRPQFTFTYTDPELDALERFKFKIFDAATIAGGGFDPETSTPVNSGDTDIVSISAYYQPVSPLIPGITYTAYIKAADSGSGQRYGNWYISPTFSIAASAGLMFDAPASPIVLGAVPDNQRSRFAILVQGRDNELQRNQSALEVGIYSWTANTNIAAGYPQRQLTQFQGGIAAGVMRSAAAGAIAVRSVSSTIAANVINEATKVVPGRLYTASVSLRLAAANVRYGYAEVLFYDSAGAFISTHTGLQTALSSTTWKTAFVSMVAPYNAAYAVMFVRMNGATAASEDCYFDHTDISPGFGQNMMPLAPSSFENGIDIWVARSTVSISGSIEYAYEGTGSLKMTSTGAASQSDAWTPQGTSGYPVVPGQRYNASAWFRNAGGPTRSCQVAIWWYTAAGAAASTASNYGTIVTAVGTTWKNASAEFVAPANAAFAAVLVQFLAPAGAGETFFVDRVELKATSANHLTPNQQSLETDATGWGVATNTTLGRSTAQFLDGAASLGMTSVASGTMSAKNILADTRQVAAAAGQSWTGSASFRSAVSGRTAQVNVQFRDAANTILLNSTGGVVTDTTTGWVTAWHTAIAPAGTAFVNMELQVNSTGAANEVHYADSMILARTEDLVWYRGGFTQTIGALIDTFTRADSASSLGSSEGASPLAWTAAAATWGIQSNQAYVASGAVNALAYITSPVIDGTMTCDIKLSPTLNTAYCGLVLRAADASNFILVGIAKTGAGSGDVVHVSKVVAGAITQLNQATSLGLINGQTYGLKVEIFGGMIIVHLDRKDGLGYLKLFEWQLASADVTQYAGPTNNKFGLWLANGTDDKGSRFDNFSWSNPPTQIVTLERSLDAGVTWQEVRTAYRQAFPTVGQMEMFYDYEIAPGVTPLYRAYTIGSESTISVTSGYSGSMAASGYIVTKTWWLKDPSDPTLNTPIKVQPPFNFSRKEPQQIFEPMGRKTSVVVTDGPRGIIGTLSLMTKSKAEYDQLNKLIENGRTLLLQDTFNRSWYIKFGESHDWQLIVAQPAQGEVYPTRHLHTVSLPFVEVSAP